MNSKPMHLFCGLGASVCAFSLSIGQTPALASNPDRAARQLNNFNARAEWRADRALRHQQRHPILTPGFRVPAPGEIIRPVNPVEPPNFERHVRPDGIKTNRHDRHTTGDTILFPGQVSSFRTTRPEVSNRSTYTNDAGKNRTLHNGVSLDLSSTDANITVGSNLLGDSEVTISVGGQTKAVGAGTRVTAAEYAALNQKLATGSQALKLNGQGAATDGSLNINLVTDDGNAIRTSEFVIPEGIEVTGDFGRHADGVRVTNDLVNYGSLYAVSSNRDRDTAVIAARDINNEFGGLITTDVPGSVSSQFGSTNSKLNLAIRADRDLNNAGEITSSGDLELSAGRSINNAGASSVAQARGNVSLNAPQINNQGLVNSTRESVHISAATDSHLLVDNTGGEIRALKGNIDLATSPGAITKTNTTLIGGNWHSHELNIVSGEGDVAGNVGDVTGLVNITGGSAQFHAAAETLFMGTINATGDPLLSNLGNLVIAANQNFPGEPLSIIAGGNISVGAGVTSLNTSGAVVNGGDILIVAGAAFSFPVSDLELTGGTVAGGNVNLTGLSTLRSGSGATTNGGDLTILAFGGTGTGTITVPAAIGIFTGGSGAGTRGNLTIVGGATTGTAVNVGVLNTVGGTGAGGNITVAAAAPTVAVGPVVIEVTAGPTQGQVNSGSFGIGAATAGSVSTSTITTDGSNVSVTGGGNVTTSTITTSGTSPAVSGGNITLTTGNTGALSTGSLNANANNTGGNGGNVTVFAGNGLPLTIGAINANASQTATGNGNGGIVSVDISQAFAFNPVGTGFSAKGGLLAGNGGSITIQNRGSGGITVDANDLHVDVAAGGGNGGHIELDATPGNGVVTFNATPLILSANAGTAVGATGGTIDISGASISFAGAAGGAHTLTAINGDNTGGVTLTTTSQGVTSTGRPITINTSGSVAISLANNAFTTTGGAGAGGALSISAGTGITATGEAFTTSSSTVNTAGGAITLNTTTGSIITGALAAGGNGNGSGGAITVGSVGTATGITLGTVNSVGGTTGSGGVVSITGTSAASISTASILAVSGATGGNAGSITVTNSGTGGINLTGGTINASSSLGSGGNIVLNAAGGGNIAFGLTTNINAGGDTTCGNITLTAQSITTTNTNLTINNDANGTAGDISINALAAGGGLTTSGGDLTVTSNRDISLVLGTTGINTVGAGNGGDVFLFTASGTMDGTGEIITTTGTAGNDGGAVTINSAAASAIDIGNITTSGGAGAGGDGGAVLISSGTGGLTVGTITANGGGTGGAVQIFASQATTLTLGSVLSVGTTSPNSININNSGTGDISTTALISGSNVTIDATVGGDILLGNGAGDNVIGTTSVAVRAFGTITQTGGNIQSGGTLTVQFGSGPVTLNTDVGFLSTNAAGQTLTINEANAIQLNSQLFSNLTVNTTTGGITTIAGITGFNALTLNAGGGGNIQLNQSITPNANGTVSLQTTNGNMAQAAGAVITTSGTGSLTINLAGGTPGNALFNTASNSINRLFGIGGGTINLNNGAFALVVESLGATQNLILTTTDSSTGIDFNAAINTTGDITLNTPRFFTDQAITARSITIQNLTGNLTVAGAVAPGAILTGTFPVAGTPGTPSVPASIIFNTVNGGQLTLIGDMAFNGDLEMNNQFGTTTSTGAPSSSLFHGNDNVTLNTGSYVQQGAIQPQITGFNFDLNLSQQGTIINTVGDVVFGLNVTLNGSDFAIVAAGDINLGNITINLSNSSGDAGDLTLLAGYTFAPNSGGQIPTINPFTFSAATPGGGDIIAGGVTINMSTTGAGNVGGSILAVAQGGSVTLGTIDASSANAFGGFVRIIAETGISVGNINTTGAISDGGVDLIVAQPSVSNSPLVTVTNGTLSGGFFSTSAASQGDITVGIINAGRSFIGATTTGVANTININGALTAQSISLNAGDGLINVTTGNILSANTNGSGGGGSILIVANDVIIPGATLTIDVSGTGAGSGGAVTYSRLGTDALVLGTDLIVNATGGLGGGSVDVNNGGDLTINAGGLNAAGVNGDGSNFTLTAGIAGPGVLALNDLDFTQDADATGINSSGGALVLTGTTITHVGPATLILTADGNGTGSGGTISFTTTEVTPMFIGNPAKPPKPPANFLQLSALGGANGDGGSIFVATGGNLTVNPTAMTAGPGTGGALSGADYGLEAGGNLVVSGALDGGGVGGGSDGDIDLQTNSKKDFSLNPTKTPKSGVLGPIIGDSIDIVNLGKGIKVNSSGALVGEDIELTAGGKGAIALATGVVLSAGDELELTANTGPIGKKPLLVDAPRISANTLGSVSINNADTNSSTDQSSAGKSFKLVTAGSVQLDDISTTAGSISVTSTGGTLEVVSGVDITAVNGAITLLNTDINNGDILIGNGSTIATSGSKGGNVVIAISQTAPKGGINTVPPPNVLTHPGPDGGEAFFDGPAGSIVAPGVMDIFMINKNVIINNSSLNAGVELITLGTGASITADPPNRSDSPSMVSMADPMLPGSTGNGFQSNNTVSLQNIRAAGFNSVSVDRFNRTTGFANIDQAWVTINSEVLTTSAPPETVSNETSFSSEDMIVNAAFHSEKESVRFEFSDLGEACLTPAVAKLTDSGVGQSRQNGSNRTADQTEVSNKFNQIPSGVIESSTDRKHYTLTHGNVVFAPTTHTTIKTPHGVVEMSADSLVLVMQSKNGLAVFDLDDQKKDSVVVTSHGRRIKLTPGRQILVSSHDSDQFEDVNPIELLQYRGLNKSQLTNGWNVYTSDFSIPSACYAVKPLRQLISSRHVESRKMARHLMKTTAVLMTLNPDRGDYTQFFKTRMTAMK